MRLTKYMRFLVLFFLVLVIYGCGAPTPQQDFHNYLREMAKLQPEHMEVRRLNQEVLGELETTRTPSSQGMRTRLLPSMNRQIQKMEAIKPRTKEVKDLHLFYLYISKSMRDGISLFADGIDARNTAMVEQATRQITRGSKEVAEMKPKTERLVAKYGLPPDLPNPFLNNAPHAN